MYSSTSEVSPDGIGIFVNKSKLSLIGSYNPYGPGSLYETQKSGTWTFSELEKIIDNAISNNISSQGVKLFADNEYLIRKLLVSAGVNMNPNEFDANTQVYKKAVSIYQKLKNNQLLLDEVEGTDKEKLEAQILAFQQKKILFFVAPYTEVAYRLSPEPVVLYNTYRSTQYNGYYGPAVTVPKDGVYKVYLKKLDGQDDYSMDPDDWNYMLFPKFTEDDNYKSILYNVSYPIIPASNITDEQVTKAGHILNQLMREYSGVDEADSIVSR